MDRTKGFVYLWRDFQSHPFWNEKPFTRAQAWIDLILLANHEDVKSLKDGRVQVFKRGTVYRSEYWLADRWGWDRKKVRRFLKLLEVEEMATTESTNRGTTITLINYGIYQNNGTTKDTNNVATPSPTDGLLFPINNNDNNKITKNSKRDIVRHKYGEYSNVFLTDDELETLKSDYPSMWNEKLESLSNYMQSTGKAYKDHFVTIKNWIRKDQKEGGVKNDYGGEKGTTFRIEDYL